jgi:hypothetical protein
MFQETPWQDQWSLNRIPLSKDQIAIILVAPEARWMELEPVYFDLEVLRKNCVALHGELTIICDVTLFRSFLDLNGLYKSSPDQVKLFMQWCLGHEIAHLVFRDNFTEMIPHSEQSDQFREYRADCWFFARWVKIERNSLVLLEAVATNLVSGALVHSSPGPLPAGVGLIYDYNRRDAQKFQSVGTHPPIIHRAARMLQFSLLLDSDPGWTLLIKSFERHLVPDLTAIPECRAILEESGFTNKNMDAMPKQKSNNHMDKQDKGTRSRKNKK